jgi:UDP-N-acetylenolpyruvoylglucosamine reductase
MTHPQRYPDLAELRIAGEVVTPQDALYEQARLAWNLAVDQRPALIAFPESANDVIETMRFARANGMRVAAQGTGHGAVALGPLDDTVLVKTSRMREVEIQPRARIARAEGGAEWQDVIAAAAEHGLLALHGSSPDVGVVGYTLGGGIGWLARKHGLAANSVTAIELVTPDGVLRRVDAEHEPDLFWALRGGGGNFGLVTAIEFRLYEHTEAYAGWLWWPLQRAGEVLQAWRRWTQHGLPDEITSVGRIMQFPPLPQVPEHIRGKSFVIVEAAYVGDEESGAELLRPLRELEPVLDSFAVVPVEELAHLHKDPPHPVAGAGDGMLLRELTADAIDELVRVAGPEGRSPLLSVELRHLGGALADARPEHGVLASVDAEYAMSAVGTAGTAEDKLRVEMHVERLQAALAPWEAGTAYQNFTQKRVDALAFYSRHTLQRLRRVKAAYDKSHTMQANHEIAPTP